MAFNPGDRVRYRYQGPKDNPDEFKGVVQYVLPRYNVLFDDGTEEIVEEDELLPEDEEGEIL